MSSPSQNKSPLVRFMESFLQEENIKWILGLGVCILLGSSIRLVTMHWHECTPVWKYMILTAYTAVIFVLGQFGYHRLGLRKTGTVLMAATVLLIPLSFLALHWIRPQGESAILDWLHPTGLTFVMTANLMWSSFAAHKIFRHFLRQTQPTFLVCYLILCVAGAVIPGLPVAWAPILALALWAVFAVGTVKVNRHIFWLTEEYRLPRIFGFFPIALLGAQFALVFLLGLASQFTPAWLGLLCTLIAMPVLLTADSVARVFEQRTGGLVRPIPWSIIGPLSLGVLLCAAGVVLALSAWPASGIVVPTALLAAIAMAVVANRTKNSAFIWGMIVCLMVTYQTCPVFFKQWLLQIRQQTETAINEPRLPYAFYGLTYAPFVIVASVVANILHRKGQTLFANPLRIVAGMLPWILFAASSSHSKAVLPVALVLCPIFFVQSTLFRERFPLIGTAMTFLAAAYGLPTFCRQIFEMDFSPNAALIVWTAAAAMMLFPGYLIDRYGRSLPWFQSSESNVVSGGSVLQLFSLTATLVAMVVCVPHLSLIPTGSDLGPDQFTPLIVATLMAAHTLRWLKPGLGELTLTFGTFAVLQSTLFQSFGLTTIEALSTLLMFQWIASYVLKAIPDQLVSRTFMLPTLVVSFMGLSVIFAMHLSTWGLVHFDRPSNSWMLSAVILAWGLNAARRLNNHILATIVWGSVFVFASAIVTAGVGVSTASAWWMLVWSVVGILLLTGLRLVSHERPMAEPAEPSVQSTAGKNWLLPLSWLLPIVFLANATASVGFLGWPYRSAGLVALAGMMVCQHRGLLIEQSVLIVPLVNWQILATVATALVGGNLMITEMTQSDLALCGLPLAACTAFSSWILQANTIRAWFADDHLRRIHGGLLTGLSLALLFHATTWHSYADWNAADIAWAATAWGSILFATFSAALRTQRSELVWATLAVGLVSFTYFTGIGIFNLSHTIVPYAFVVAGFSLWTLRRAAVESSRYKIVTIPFCLTGFFLPLMVIPLTFWRIEYGPPSPFAGANSLAMLSAAAFYFWRGMARRDVVTSLISAVILNVAFMLLWREIHWTDPQLFLMPIGISILGLTELLNREIPSRLHNDLRRIGSLVILVSPTFHILTGSWLHILTLMIASVCVCLLAIGLRVRTLLYTGAAFLLADLVAMVARGAIDQPNLLWIVGVLVGGAVITLGAICENHRETVLSRLRGMSAALETWN